MSFRARLALVAAAAVALAVVAASAVVYFVVRDELYSSVDASLRSSMEHIQHGPVVRLHGAARRSRASSAGTRRSVRQDGVTCCKRQGESLPLPVTNHDLSVARGQNGAYYTDARVGGSHVRILTFPYQPGFAVQIARPLDEVDRSLARIRWLLILIATGGTLVAARPRPARLARGARAGPAADRGDRARDRDRRPLRADRGRTGRTS